MSRKASLIKLIDASTSYSLGLTLRLEMDSGVLNRKPADSTHHA